MAKCRMFSKDITEGDPFLDLPLSAQALWFHLGMLADDRGIVTSPRSVMRSCGANNGDMQALIEAKFIIAFEYSPSIVIKHWPMCNRIRKDRFTETTQLEILRMLNYDELGNYSANPIHAGRPCLPSEDELVEVDDNQMTTTCQPSDNQLSTKPQPNDNQMTTTCQPNDNQMTTTCQPNGGTGKDRLGKDRLGKDRLIKEYACGDAALEAALLEFCKMRVRIKKPMTDRALELLLQKLDGYEPTERIPVLEQSIENSWSGIYPHKRNYNQPPKKYVTAAEYAQQGPDELAMRAVAARRARREQQV